MGGSRLLMMRLWSNLILSRGRTKILLMKSRISLTNWEMAVAQSMSWTNNAAAWKLRKKSSNPPLRKLRLLLNKKRTKFLGLNLSLDKFDKILIARFKRRRKSLIILERTTNVPWTLWQLLLKVNSVLRVKLFELRRNLKVTSMNLKLLWTMATRLMLKDKKQSRGTKGNSEKPLQDLRNKPMAVKKSWRLLALLSARLVLSAERLKNLVLFLILLTAANVNLNLNWLMLALLSVRWQSSITGDA